MKVHRVDITEECSGLVRITYVDADGVVAASEYPEESIEEFVYVDRHSEKHPVSCVAE